MPEWLVGSIGVAVLPLIAFIWKSFQVRAKVVKSGQRIGSVIRKVFRGYDIPVIAGKTEESLKERVISTVGDFIHGLHCGFTGRKINDD
jgi:hypothetical protein